MNPNQQISVVVKDRTGVIWEGVVKSLTSKNDTGPFDVLPLHANFISLCNEKITMKLADGETKEMQVATGLLKVFENRAEIFLGIGEGR